MAGAASKAKAHGTRSRRTHSRARSKATPTLHARNVDAGVAGGQDGADELVDSTGDDYNQLFNEVGAPHRLPYQTPAALYVNICTDWDVEIVGLQYACNIGIYIRVNI